MTRQDVARVRAKAKACKPDAEWYVARMDRAGDYAGMGSYERACDELLGEVKREVMNKMTFREVE